MPNYSLNEENHIISASEALRSNFYFCIECKSPMRLQGGPVRRPYFAHTKKKLSCRLHSRSIDHLVLQEQLKKQYPFLKEEQPFPKIRRIADLCWEEKNIVFEIQCSPIPAQQAEDRIRDYAMEGYSLIWLLDDRLYNQRSLRPFELNLRKQGYFFSLKLASIYDQFEVTRDQVRIFKGPKLFLDLSLPLPFLKIDAPRQLAERTSNYFFYGDLFDRITRSKQYLPQLIELEKEIVQNQPKTHSFFLRLFRELFYRGLEFLLRSISKQ